MPRITYKGRRRKRFKKRYKGSGLARKNYKDLKFIKKAIEVKFIDEVLSNQHLNTTGTINHINGVAQGDAQDERAGRKVQSRKIKIRGYINNDRGTPEDAVCRMMLVRVKQPKTLGTGLALLDLVKTSSVNSFYTPDGDNRFQVYFDHTFAMDTTQHSLIPFKITQKLNHEVLYTETTTGATETDIARNAMYLVYWSTVAGTTNDPVVNMTVRYTYVDL